MKKTLIYLMAVLCINGVLANEPLWTEKERAGKREIVLTGEVLKVEKLHELKNYKWLEIWKADIKVSEIQKGAKGLKGKTIPLFYERGTIIKGTKIRNKRCPQCADLEVGKRYKFFITECKEAHLKRLEIKEKPKTAYMIEMGSDAILHANLTGSQLTIKQAVDKSTHIFRGVKLDDPGPAICDEIGVLGYSGKFSVTEILYGSRSPKKILQLSYTVLEFKPRDESPIEKNEKVIVFMNKSQAIKIITDNKENIKKIKASINTTK